MDERRNSEYYMDLTAYHAIRNIERENRKMDNSMKYTMQAGEIWKAEYSNYEKPVIIVAVNESACCVLGLNDKRYSDADIEVVGIGGIKYTRPELLSYKFHENFVSYVRTLSDIEFKTIRNGVQEMLGFSSEAVCPDHSEEIEWYDEECQKLRANNEELLQQLEKAQNQTSTAADTEKIIRLETERDFYKQQYDQLFERLISK